MDWAPRFRVPEVEGEGVFAIPVGPIHAGLVEPAHFRFASAGESVLQLDVKLGWTWRGLEKLAEGGTLQRGLEIAERLCGGCSFAHALAWCGAVEELAGLTVPPRARGIRTIAAELERIANHLADLAGITDHVACPLAAMEYTRAQEVVRQIADALFGQRFLRGLCVPGGVTLDLDDTQQQWLRQVVADLRARTTLTTRDALATGSVVERLQGAGRLDPAAVQAWGATGPVARASGATRDARRDHPYAFYRELDFEVARGETGDARARLDVRVAEIHESLNLIDQLLLRLPGGPTAQHLGAPPADRWGCGLVESPRGLLTHWLRLDPEGRVADWRVRSASHALWPALAHAATGDLVPDFPLVNRSFGLCHGCTDK
jgi:Ni,Fe-hydrogenase III large subunit